MASVNLEFSRENPQRWEAWVKNLKKIAKDPRNIIAANNHYDLEYIKYFTGIEPAYIPAYCGYVNTDYHPSGNQASNRDFGTKRIMQTILDSFRQEPSQPIAQVIMGVHGKQQ